MPPYNAEWAKNFMTLNKRIWNTTLENVPLVILAQQRFYLSTDTASPPCRDYVEGWVQDYGNSNIFLKPLFRGNLDPFVNNANLGAIAHTSNGT